MNIIAFNHHWVIRWHWMLVNILAVSILLSLSFWQLQRAEQKQQNLATIAQWQTQPARSLTDLLAGDSSGKSNLFAGDGASMAFVARWVSPYVWLLDNQIINGRAGYDVLLPVQQNDERNQNTIVLVNLGWVSAPESRAELPPLKIPDEIYVQGIYRATTDGLLLGKNLEDKGDWPMRIQKIDTQLLAPYVNGKVNGKLISGVIYQQQNSPFIIHYKPVVLPPERHKAYALQWFLLAVAALLVGLACANESRACIHQKKEGYAGDTK